VVQRCDLFVLLDVEVGAAGAEESQQLLDVLYLAEHVPLHLSLPLQFFSRRILELLHVVERENPSLASQRALPPVLVDRLENRYDISFPEL
jgi:hypothetical protein